MVRNTPEAAPAGSKPRLALRFGGGLFVVLLVGFAALQGGCGSLPIEDVRAELLDLEGNGPFAAALEVHPLDGWDAPLRAAHFEPAAAPDPGARPLVLVHGTPDSMGAFGELLFGAGGLAAGRDVWTLEVIGHGMAGGRAGGVTFQRCADYVAAGLDALGLRDVTLLGHSYGGEFCWRLALDRPDLVGRLVLIDSSGLARTDAQFLPEERKMRDWGWIARQGYLLNSESRVASALDPHFPGGAPEKRVREMFLCLENRGNWNATVDLARDENGGRAEELGDLAMPTLLVFGSDDLAYPAETFGRAFERAIPQATLAVIEGAGHYPHESHAQETAVRVAEFMDAE